MRLRRRTVLLSVLGLAACGGTAAAAALVEHATLPGKARLDKALGRCDAAAVPASATAAADPPVTGNFTSRARGRDVGYAISVPPGVPLAGLPVCLALHGFGSNAAGAVRDGDYPAVVAAAVRAGAAPFALAAVDGGDGYWHPHAGDDPLGMLTDEFVPLLAGKGLDTTRLAVAGWSMGGYGALLAALEHRALFKAVVASSPAVRALRAKLPDPSVVQFGTGCHDGRFWASVAPAQVRAISAALTK